MARVMRSPHAVQIRKGLIQELLYARVNTVGLSRQQTLTAALLRKARAARIRNPDLDRAEPRRTQCMQCITMFLNACVDGSHVSPLPSCYMQRYRHSIRYMQRPSIPSPPQSFSRSSSAALTTTKTEPKLCHSAPVTGVRAPAADSATALALMRREAMMLVRTFRITFRIRRNR